MHAREKCRFCITHQRAESTAESFRRVTFCTSRPTGVGFSVGASMMN
ncbi:MAG: hypothetical protein PUB37_02670 [Firmicutes bacterium]|nr:hypothetical protein [Bacillota bacterium]